MVGAIRLLGYFPFAGGSYDNKSFYVRLALPPTAEEVRNS
jgi:hypothetical protein